MFVDVALSGEYVLETIRKYFVHAEFRHAFLLVLEAELAKKKRYFSINMIWLTAMATIEDNVKKRYELI